MNADPDYMRLRAEIESFWTKLPDKPEETPEAILAALWLTATGTPTSVVKASGATLPPLSAASRTRLNELIALKRAGQPVAHLTERQHFMGLELLAGPDALIPRSETAILGNAAIAKLKQLRDAQRDVRVIDLCTGSGNLPLAYAAHVPGCQIWAADLSLEAVEFAKRNALQAGLGHVQFRQGDLFAPFDSEEFWGRMDMITCNPPYISAAKVSQMHPEISGHEPKMAFDGGAFGISILSRLLNETTRFLRSGGWLGFEVGLGQGPAMAKRMAAMSAFTGVETYTDAEGNVRALFAKMN
jgi:release factor glutamine methyltransferase